MNETSDHNNGFDKFYYSTRTHIFLGIVQREFLCNNRGITFKSNRSS